MAKASGHKAKAWTFKAKATSGPEAKFEAFKKYRN